MGGKYIHIGALKMIGQMTSSNWGDKSFYIRHQVMTEDLDIHPEWKPYTDLNSLGGKCPFNYKKLMNLSLF